jgi:hypothetical protein
MPQFTQLNLQNKSDSKSQTKPEFIGKQTIALFSGVVLATALVGGLLLETSGCSRENDTAVSSAIQHPVTQPVTNPPVPIQEASASPVATTAAKKIVKKRPTAVLYADKNYGVTFTYPKRYTLKSAAGTKPDAIQPSSTNFIQPGGVDVVTVELPKNSYPHTDLASASFKVSVNPTLTAEQCSQFALLQPASTDKPAILPAKVKVAGLDLEAIEAISGSEASQSDAKYYHTFVNGACYEFSLGLATQAQAKDKDDQPRENEDPAPAVDRTAVFRRLQSILATVKIESITAPAVTATVPMEPATPAVPAADVATK